MPGESQKKLSNIFNWLRAINRVIFNKKGNMTIDISYILCLNNGQGFDEGLDEERVCIAF